MYNVILLEKKKLNSIVNRLRWISIIFYPIRKVSPSKPKLCGSEHKSISKEIKEAIMQFLESNHSSLAVSTERFLLVFWKHLIMIIILSHSKVSQCTPTHALDADFMQILADKRDEQLKATSGKSMDLESSANRECDDMFRCDGEFTDNSKNCSFNDKDNQPNESTFYEDEFSS